MSKKTRLTLGVATVAATCAALLTPAGQALAAPSITVTPSSSLFNGAVVTVSASGLPASTAVAIVECNASGADASYCDTKDVQVVNTDSSGAIAGQKLTIASGQIGTNAAAVCTYATNGQCVVALANASTQAPLGAAPITFSNVTATPATSLKNGQTVSVSGQGLPPSTKVVLVECYVPIGGTTGCNLGNLAFATTDASGNLPATSYTVKTGQQGSDATSICSYSTNGKCAIAVGDLATSTPYGGATVTFAQTYTTLTTALTAVASKTIVLPGRAFNIHGRTLVNKHGANGLTVTLYKRAGSKQAWTKVVAVKSRTINAVTGAYRFALKGLRHSEQYQVRHPRQIIGTRIYTRVISKIITIKP